MAVAFGYPARACFEQRAICAFGYPRQAPFALTAGDGLLISQAAPGSFVPTIHRFYPERLRRSAIELVSRPPHDT